MPFFEPDQQPGFRPDVTQPPPRRPEGDVAQAAFERENEVISLYTRMKNSGHFEPVEGHNPLNNPRIRGTKFEANHLDSFIASRSPAEDDAIIARIEQEEQRDALLEANGVAGTVYSTVAGLLSPTMLLPGGALWRVARAGRAVRGMAAAAEVGAAGLTQSTVQEGALQATQETRSMAESAVAVGSATILSAFLGGAVGLLSKPEAAALAKSIDIERAKMDAHAGNNEFVGAPLPAAGVAPANIGADGKIYVGKRNTMHYLLSEQYAEKIRKEMNLQPGDATWRQEGFVTPDGQFLDRKQAFEWVTANEKKIKSSDNMVDGELDALDYYEQVPETRRSTAGTAGSGMATSAGAAAADTRKVELAGALGVEKVTAGFDPMSRLLSSESVTARRAAVDLAETPLMMKENADGVATTQGAALDREARLHINQTRVAVADELDRQFSSYRFGGAEVWFPRTRALADRVMARDEGLMTYAEFDREVGKAARNGDQHPIPQVQQAAQFIRSRVFEPWKNRAIEAGIFDKDVDVKTAESYFQRVYDKPAIGAKRPVFVDRVTEWLAADQSTKAEAKQRLEFFNAQLKSWQQQIAKLEARFGRAEERAKKLDAKADERARDDRPQTVGLNDPQAAGRIADLQTRKAELAVEANDMAEAIDLMEDLVRLNPQLAQPLERTLSRFETLGVRQKVVGAKHQEAGRGGKISEKRLAAIEEQLSQTEARQALIEDYLETAQKMHDDVRAKIEAEIGAWEGKSTSEAKSALKAREKYAADTKAAGKESKGRLTGADDHVDRAVRRIIDSDRDLSIEELRARAAEITNRILGSPDGRLPYDLGMDHGVSGFRDNMRGSLQAREFMIPDKLIEDFLDSSAERVTQTHLRTLVPDVLLTERFGDVKLTALRKQIDEEYAQIAEAARGNEKKLQKIEKERQQVIGDLAAITDRIRGIYAYSADPFMRNAARFGNAVKNYNVITSMGSATVSSLSDMAGPIFRNGLATTFSDGWVPFFKFMAGNGDAWKEAKRQYRAMGIVTETTLSQRHHALDDIVDFNPQSRVERTLQWGADRFQLVNFLAQWTDWGKTTASVVAGAEILRATEAVAKGTATAKQIRNLAASNIDQQLAGRIWRQFDPQGDIKAGAVQDGVYLPNTGDWKDAGARSAFEGAVAREADIAVITPGQEKPLWMSHGVTSILGQFKGFTAASTQRVLLANLQKRDAASLQGLIFSLSLGMMSYKLNSVLSGTAVSERPQDWVKEGFSRSGMFGWFEEGNALASKLSRGQVDVYRAIGADKPLSRYASRSTIDQLLGPTVGKIEAMAKVTGAAASRDWSQSDTHALRRLAAFQNLFYVRRLFDAAEHGLNGALGVQEKAE